jgi:dTDP-4-dehydrorhamnose 3,5-epimerase
MYRRGRRQGSGSTEYPSIHARPFALFGCDQTNTSAVRPQFPGGFSTVHHKADVSEREEPNPVKVTELAVPDAYSVHPLQFNDARGVFLEWYRHEALAEAVGHPLGLAQANCSVSRAGSVRGVHYADIPPGQAKYVTCVRGAVLDVVVDLRVGSPAFGQFDVVRLDDVERAAVYLAEGLGHAFVALTDDTTVVYLCSSVYNPVAEHGLNPLDPDLGIEWPTDVPLLLSDKDTSAPSLAAAVASGALPDYQECRAYYATLAAQPNRSR